MSLKSIKNVNFKLIKKEIELLYDKYPFLKNENQISLQSYRKNGIAEKDWNCSTGRMDNLTRKEMDYHYPLFPELEIILINKKCIEAD